MRRTFLDMTATRLVAGTTALAGMLLFAGCSSSMKAPLQTPALTPAGGTFTASQSVTVSDTTPGAVLRCTVDGSAPTKSSPLCGNPVIVYQSETLSAVAVAPDGSVSAAVSAAYVISPGAAATPVISPGSGTYTTAQSVTITDATPGAVLYYTIDGSAPTTSSTVYSGPITVSATETVSAVAISAGTTLSAVASAAFTINLQAATPVITPPGGSFTAVQTATITDATPNAMIYYTLDGSAPNPASSPLYTAPISVDQSETITAVAVAPGYAVSTAASAVFALSQVVAAPVFSPAAGTYLTSQTVTLADSTAGAAIYYTTDGSTPTAGSTRYTAPFVVLNSATVRAIAIASGSTASAVATAAYVITTVTKVPLAGTVMSGSAPIANASVQLYAAGTTGYASAPTALLNTPVTSAANGSFTLSYLCPAAPGDQVYLVATGGSVNGRSNAMISLMAALGSCANLSSTTSVTINEATTIASVYALAAFSSVPQAGAGIQVGTPTACPTIPTGNSCNYTGLVNAFRTVGNLVDLTTGAVRTITPFYATNPVPFLNSSTVPQSRINTLADILATCVDQAVASGCQALFTDTVLTEIVGTPATPTSVTPRDTLQAALSIAQHPGTNVAGLFGLIPTSSSYRAPYLPRLTGSALNSTTSPPQTYRSGPPPDFTIALTFTGGGLGIPPGSASGLQIVNTGLEVDTNGNILVAAYNSASSATALIAIFNPLGGGLTPPTTLDSKGVATYGGVQISGITQSPAFTRPLSLVLDQMGNAWLDSANSLVEVTSSELANRKLGATTRVVVTDNNSTASNLTIDSTGNIWSTSLPSTSGLLREFGSDGTTKISGSNGRSSDGAGGETIGIFNPLNRVTFDSNGGVWASSPSGNLYQVSAAGGLIQHDYATNSSSRTTVPTNLVADSNKNIYGCATGNSNGSMVDTFTSTNLSIVSGSTLSLANGRGCGGSNPLIMDGAQSLFTLNPAVSVGTYPVDPNDPTQGNINYTSPVLDEFTTRGISISPTSRGYSGTSLEEYFANTATTGTNAGQPEPTAFFGIPVSIKIDGSGNLWGLEPSTGSSSNGNVLVEFVGIAAPVANPISVSLANGELATRP